MIVKVLRHLKSDSLVYSLMNLIAVRFLLMLKNVKALDSRSRRNRMFFIDIN